MNTNCRAWDTCGHIRDHSLVGGCGGWGGGGGSAGGKLGGLEKKIFWKALLNSLVFYIRRDN